MNRSIEILKSIYKPYRYTIKGQAHILNSTSGDIVVKEKSKDIKKLYDYLSSRNFSYYPNLIDESREGVNVFEYVNDTDIPKEQKANDLIKIVAMLHQKTSYYKEVTLDDYQKIYDDIKAQIDYLSYYYNNIFDEFFKEVYPSPSHYFLLTNISKILASFEFSSHELENWFNMVKDKKEFRVCQIHNNLSLEHYRKSDKDCLLSWEKSRIDSPILDLVKFYQTEFFDIPFSNVFKTYLSINSLSEEEKKLFFVIISLPDKILFKGNEFQVYQRVRNVLDYVYKTEELIRPYYAVEKKE